MVISNETNGPPYTWSQSYVLMEESQEVVFRLLLVLNFEHSDVLLVKVKILVKYTHIYLKFKLF